MVRDCNLRVIVTLTPRSQVELTAIMEWKDWKKTQVINEAIHSLMEKLDKERR